MATYVDIANLALSHLGDDATISALDEASPQADHISRFLPIARDTILEMHPWKFAVRRVQPALLANTNTAWRYAYAEPANCIRILGVLPEGYVNDVSSTIEYECESIDDVTTVVLANSPVGAVRYISRVENPARFTPLFTETLAWLLACYVAGPLIKGQEGQAAANTCWGSFLQMFARASGSNANQSKLRLNQEAGWIMARGGFDNAWLDLGPVRG